MIGRRQFITLLGGAAAWPVAARAQQPDRMKRAGVLMSLAENDHGAQVRLAAFREALEGLGWIEGRNIRFEVRWSGGDVGRAHAYAAELVERAPDIILAHGTPATAAVKQVTRSIPVVFVIVNDPVGQGFVASVAHPGGKIAGFSFIDYSVLGKSLDLLKQMAPGVTHVAFMFNPESAPFYNNYVPLLQNQVRTLSLELTEARVHSDLEIEATLAKLAMESGGALLSAPDSFMNVHRALLIGLSAQRRLPAVFPIREAVLEGGLMSYAPDQIDIFLRSASYGDRILKGTSPADLPVQAPTKFELVINLKTAKALGLTVSRDMQLIADEVIE
jgi:putative ABC transport system substrate-binding protein